MPIVVRRLPVALALAAGVACHKASGPRPTLSVAITLVPPPATATVVEGGVTKINCDARLQAKATGTGDATWVGGTVYFFRGNDESKVFATKTVTADQLLSTWGSLTITGGETRSTTYRLSAEEPFGGVVEFRYRQGGGRDERIARIPVHCAG
jgi:hypothetical protein